jgi:hypothetical protein
MSLLCLVLNITARAGQVSEGGLVGLVQKRMEKTLAEPGRLA